MSLSRKLSALLMAVIVLGGLYVTVRPESLQEGMIGQHQCPNLLIQRGPRLYLYNTRKAEVPGVNPISFRDLNDYAQFLDWQHSNGIRCPVLYLRKGYNAQGQMGYRMHPSPFEPQAGLPPAVVNLHDRAQSKLSTAAADEGVSTTTYENKPALWIPEMAAAAPIRYRRRHYRPSDLATDPGWIGEAATEKLVESGKYEGDYVYKIGS